MWPECSNYGVFLRHMEGISGQKVAIWEELEQNTMKEGTWRKNRWSFSINGDFWRFMDKF